MYYSNINNTELQEFHKSVKLCCGFEEIEDYTPLYDNSKTNRLIPLFYTDNIRTNENCRTVNDKIVLYTNVEDLDSVYFQSTTDNVMVGVWHKITDGSLYLHFYEQGSLFNKANQQFHIIQWIVANDRLEGDFETDEYGNIIIPLKDTIHNIFRIILPTGQEIKWGY